MKTMENKIGILGTILAPLMAFIGFLTDYSKELQALSYFGSCVIAALTIPWLVRKLWRWAMGKEIKD